MQELNIVEGHVVLIVQWLKLAVEIVGILLVAAGVSLAVAQIVRMVAKRGPFEFTEVRLTLARYLALALEFELGADVLGTAVSPDWDHIGKLGAIAVIRTGLNFFLSKEIQDEQNKQNRGDRTDECSKHKVEEREVCDE